MLLGSDEKVAMTHYVFSENIYDIVFSEMKISILCVLIPR